jgi:hypothetical protein
VVVPEPGITIGVAATAPKSARFLALIAPPTFAGEFAIDLLHHGGPRRGAAEVWFKMLMLRQHPTGVLPNLFNKFFPKKLLAMLTK